MCYNILMKLMLASNSPRRHKLLSLGGWDFIKRASEIDESVLSGETPQEYVLRLAHEKALAVKQSMEQDSLTDWIILAADTTVVDPNFPAERGFSESIILGKPKDAQEAMDMLMKLRDRNHRVFTGLAAYRLSDGMQVSEVVSTEVPMRNYSDDEILQYIASGDPFDKAGAYAIQHAGFRPVQNLQGCYANVTGLPICHASRLLALLDYPALKDVSTECQRYLEYECPVYRQALLQADPQENDLMR